MAFAFGYGRAVVHGNTAYFSYNNYDNSIIYSFTVSDNRWTMLPKCKYSDFAMVIVNGKLTTIGGHRAYNNTDAIMSLTSESSPSWRAIFPPLPTKQSFTDAIATHTHLVVAGDFVQILDLKTLQWSAASNIPLSASHYNVTQLRLCDGHFYIVQGHAAFSCQVEELLKSCKPPSVHKNESKSVWTKLPDIPVRYTSRLEVWREHVLAIGGRDDFNGDHPTAAVHCYSRATNSWSEIGQLPAPRSVVLSVVLPSNELMVVGGRSKNRESRDVYFGYEQAE